MLSLNATNTTLSSALNLPDPPAYLETIQVSTASVSFIASTIIVFAITCFGNVGLSTPYRRIIFGLSSADILQSLALMAGPSAVSPDLSGEAGSEATSCKVNGFILSAGASATLMYTFFLCLYYLCKLKYRMTDNAFRHRIEKKFHAFIVVFCLVVNGVALALDVFHTNSTYLSFCSIGPTPTGCEKKTEVECDPTITKRCQYIGNLTLRMLPILFFVGIVVTMGLLYRYAYVLNQTITRELIVPTGLRSRNSREEGIGEEEETALGVNEGESVDEKTETPQDRLQHLSRLYRREITIQATSYVGVFCLIYIPIFLGPLLWNFGIYSHGLNVVIMTTYPLGGCLNILVYTRPKIAVLRRSHPECSFLRGFWLVIRAGGEIPNEVDLSVTCCQDCCRPPAWLNSEFDTTTIFSQQKSADPAYAQQSNDSSAPKSLHLSRLGF